MSFDQKTTLWLHGKLALPGEWREWRQGIVDTDQLVKAAQAALSLPLDPGPGETGAELERLRLSNEKPHTSGWAQCDWAWAVLDWAGAYTTQSHAQLIANF